MQTLTSFTAVPTGLSANWRIHTDWVTIADRGTSPRARAPTGRAYFERVSVTERRRIEPCPLPAAARLRVTFRTRERECGGMATHDVEGVDEDDGTGDLLDRRPGAWEGVWWGTVSDGGVYATFDVAS